MSGLSTLRSFKDVGKFKSIRANATSLHNALFNNFTHHCECSMSHIANLRLESRDGISNITVDGTDGETRDLSFDVLFAFTATSTDGSPGLAWPWRETAIQSINGAFYNDEPESGIGLPLNLCAPPVASVTSKSVPAPGSSQSYRHDSGAANVRYVACATPYIYYPSLRVEQKRPYIQDQEGIVPGTCSISIRVRHTATGPNSSNWQTNTSSADRREGQKFVYASTPSFRYSCIPWSP